MAPRLALVMFAIALALRAQDVGSGSTGIDGALVLTTPGTITFDPRTFSPPLNSAGDNVYHFTRIQIAAGVTVKLSTKLLHGPVFWLSQGPVQIDGVIDLNGEDGSAAARVPSNAGAGGYPGGMYRKPGYGPGAGPRGGIFTGNEFLVPLFGGSGGAGGEDCSGGAGGGALLISSSTSITVNGTISANGGSSARTCGAGGGSGGAIRLVAPAIDGLGTLVAIGGKPDGGHGRVRLETLANNMGGSTNDTPMTMGKPFGLFLPPSPPASIRIAGVAGVPVDLGSKELLRLPQMKPTSSPVTISIEARFVPPGTVVELEFFAEDGTEQIVKSTPLEGTLERSTATASVPPMGAASVGYVKANWKQP
jgi:hypothetical protein